MAPRCVEQLDDLDALASRMSSVLGLKASPSTATVLSVQRAQRLARSSSTKRAGALAVDVHHRPQQLRSRSRASPRCG